MQGGIPNPDEIISKCKGFQESRILLTSIELKIFTLIDSHLLTADEIAKKIDSHIEPLERLLNALVALGYLGKVKGKFYNSQHSVKYLNENSPEFIASLKHYSNMWKNWSELTSKIKKVDNSEDFSESFIAAMHYRAGKQADIIPHLLNLSEVKRIIDIGGGSGIFSMGILKYLPGAEAVLLDLPHIIPIAQKYIEQEGFSSKFSFIPGNYLIADFGSGYDLAILSAILHINSYEENEELIGKTYDSLNSGGQIVINEFIIDENGTEPLSAAIFSLNMLVGTDKGKTYKFSEINAWLENAHFKGIELKPTGFGTNLIVAYK